MERAELESAVVKILVIDDEEIVRESCTRILKNQEYIIKTAADGKTGLEILEQFKPDLVLVDLKMPGLSGFEVLEEIFAFDPTIVTIVITGFATVDSAVESMKKGTFDFIPKPFQPEELRLVVRRGLERRNLVLETIALRKEKDMLREHFAAIVSHELKSPLGAVQQNLYVLADELDEILTEEQRAKVKRLQNRIKELINLINTWLRVISVDISKIKEQFEVIDINQMVQQALETVEGQATRKDITLKLKVEDGSIQVNGDKGALTEAVINLLTNSIKYTNMGGEVILETHKEPSLALVTVQDNGIGIEEEEITNIFTDFYRGKNIPEGERSSGVGLSITNRIIEAHGGSIKVESKLGQGSTFTILLPLVTGEE